MEQLIDSEMVQKIEKVLQEVELIQVSKLVSCTKMPSELQGYLSQSMKIKCYWVAEDNKKYVKHLYLKCYDESKEAHRAMRLKDSHFNEVYYYRQLQHHLGNFGPRCFSADEKDIIVEDLTYDGYQVNPLSQMLSYHQMKAALKRSAEFHAASLKWKLSNKEEFEYCLEPLREIAYPNDGRWSLGLLLKYGLSFALEVLKQNDSENHRAYRLLNKYQHNIDQIMTKLLQPRFNKYDVLTHGDMWKNNILFKIKNSHEFDVKLIDFQIIRHASVALDILYLIYSSADLDVLSSDQYDDLITYYHSQLIENLSNKEQVADLTMDWLKNELKVHALYGLVYSFMTVHVSCNDNENSNKLTNRSDETNKGSQISPTYVEEIEAAMTNIPHNSIKTKRVLTVIKHFIDQFTATEK